MFASQIYKCYIYNYANGVVTASLINNILTKLGESRSKTILCRVYSIASRMYQI